MITCRVLACCAAVLIGSLLGQTPESNTPVHISGRLVDPNGNPVGNDVHLSRIGAEDTQGDVTALAGPDGRFTFSALPGPSFRIYLGNGIKTPPKTVDTNSHKDIDVGDMVVEYCTVLNSPKPTPVLIVDLKPEQIVIEPQQSMNANQAILPAPTEFKESHALESPHCWSWPSLDRRSEWQSSMTVMFEPSVTIQTFVGGKLKVIRVIRYNPNLTHLQIRNEVQKVWLGAVVSASAGIDWAEGNLWNIQASVEFEDGKRTSITTDGGHVQVEDREGKYWFMRIRPAAH